MSERPDAVDPLEDDEPVPQTPDEIADDDGVDPLEDEDEDDPDPSGHLTNKTAPKGGFIGLRLIPPPATYPLRQTSLQRCG